LRNESTDTGVSNTATQGHQDSNPTDPDTEYPEQKHAGKVGLGPEYGKKSRETHGINAKIKGYKEEFKGTVTRNSDLVQKGKERRTGDLAQKEEEKKENDNPFEKAAPPASEAQKDDQEEEEQKGDGTGTNSDALNIQDHAPTSDHAARQQAATTEPEGTENAEAQEKEGTELKRDAQMNSVQPTAF